VTHDIKATVEELERLEREATKGPWAPDVSAPYPGGDYGCYGVGCLEEHAYPLWKEAVAKSWTQTVCTTPHDSRYSKGEQARTNMEFIAAARNALPSLLAELRRLWAIEEAAVSLREAQNAYRSCKKLGAELDDAWESIIRSEHRLFAALPLRKPSGGEDGKP
jgi:hypothetical protein